MGESDAIMFYFAEGTPYLPDDRFERAQVLQWLFFEVIAVFVLSASGPVTSSSMTVFINALNDRSKLRTRNLHCELRHAAFKPHTALAQNAGDGGGAEHGHDAEVAVVLDGAARSRRTTRAGRR